MPPSPTGAPSCVKGSPAACRPAAPPRPSPAQTTSQPPVTAPEGWGSVHGPSRERAPHGGAQTQTLSQPGPVGGGPVPATACRCTPVSLGALVGLGRFSHRNLVPAFPFPQVESGHVRGSSPHRTGRPESCSGPRFRNLEVGRGAPSPARERWCSGGRHRESGSVTQGAHASPACTPLSV